MNEKLAEFEAVADVTAKMDASPRELAALLTELRAKAATLPADHREKALFYIRKLEEEVAQEKPHRSLFEVCARALADFVPLVPTIDKLMNLLASIGA